MNREEWNKMNKNRGIEYSVQLKRTEGNRMGGIKKESNGTQWIRIKRNVIQWIRIEVNMHII